MASYKELVVWQRAMELVVAVYELTEKFPAAERFGLTSQLRRAAVSIASNIAEGRYRSSRADFRQFLIIAFASAAEVETQLEIAKRMSFGKNLDYTELDRLLIEVLRMLNKMIHLLERSKLKAKD